jgi:hypothetical protein
MHRIPGYAVSESRRFRLRSCEFWGDMPAISGRCRAALPHCEQFRSAGRILGLRYTVQLSYPLKRHVTELPGAS